MGESVFALLFKYRPVLFQRGELAFSTPWPLVLLAAAGAVVAVVAYVRLRGGLPPRHRALLGALRLAALLVVLFALTRPTLVVPTVVPQQNFLGILIDDSRSMRIADRTGQPRGAFVADAFGDDGVLRAALARQFQLRFFRFAGGTERVGRLEEIGFTGTETHVGQALDRVRQDLSAVPLAGIVLVTDGADHAGDALGESVHQLRAAGVPVYAVGVGEERIDRDIEIARVETPRTVLEGSSLVVEVLVTQTGYRGKTVRLDVEDAGRIVASQAVRLPADGEAATVRVQFTAAEAGVRRFQFRILPEAGERVTENNMREALVVVDERRNKILYFEGEPRFEVKFIRRAVAGDPNLQVVVLQRTAENKFLRLDVDHPEELAAGFPKTREELFGYRGVVLGSIEASYFTHDQLRMLAEFVRDRGGGLLVLGGRRALGEGGYAGTPLADAVPIELERAGDGAAGEFFQELRVELTPVGRLHPATQIAPTLDSSAARWARVPPLSSVNRVTGVKPGASTLLVGRNGGRSDASVVLAYQRYGRGRALAFPVQDSWLWQMHADVPLDDQTHETFWRQLLRWLVSYVPDPVTATTSADRVAPGAPVVLSAAVADSAYAGVNGAAVIARVVPPSGVEADVSLEWNVAEDGAYRGRFVPAEEGLHRVTVMAHRGGTLLGSHTTFFEAGDPNTEYFGATMRRPALERVAEETGGRFYRAQDVAALPEDVRFTESGATVFERHDLWNMPIVLLLLMGLVTAEWSLRRARGLA